MAEAAIQAPIATNRTTISSLTMMKPLSGSFPESLPSQRLVAGGDLE